jgi:F0F1-type ATP synthase assembly protein I
MRSTSAGVEFILTFALPLAGGLWLDRWLGTMPGFMLLGGAAGFALGLYRLVRVARAVQDKDDDGGPQQR